MKKSWHPFGWLKLFFTQKFYFFWSIPEKLFKFFITQLNLSKYKIYWTPLSRLILFYMILKPFKKLSRGINFVRFLTICVANKKVSFYHKKDAFVKTSTQFHVAFFQYGKNLLILLFFQHKKMTLLWKEISSKKVKGSSRYSSI